jgi:ABC-type glycerol-3-phosphate transport system permease component
VNANGGKVSTNFSQWWRVVMALTVLLTLPLTVAFPLLKKPFIHAGFDNLDTD